MNTVTVLAFTDSSAVRSKIGESLLSTSIAATPTMQGCCAGARRTRYMSRVTCVLDFFMLLAELESYCCGWFPVPSGPKGPCYTTSATNAVRVLPP